MIANKNLKEKKKTVLQTMITRYKQESEKF